MKTFRRVTEAVVDSRRRISLGKAGVSEDTRYEVSISDDGDILLTPLTTIPSREQWVWARPALVRSIQEGIAQAARGEVHDLGSFSQYRDDDTD